MTNNKETYWSQFVDDYEDRQAFVTGNDLIRITIKYSDANIQYL